MQTLHALSAARAAAPAADAPVAQLACAASCRAASRRAASTLGARSSQRSCAAAHLGALPPLHRSLRAGACRAPRAAAASLCVASSEAELLRDADAPVRGCVCDAVAAYPPLGLRREWRLLLRAAARHRWASLRHFCGCCAVSAHVCAAWHRCAVR
jgi:hypothetical protein